MSTTRRKARTAVSLQAQTQDTMNSALHVSVWCANDVATIPSSNEHGDDIQATSDDEGVPPWKTNLPQKAEAPARSLHNPSEMATRNSFPRPPRCQNVLTSEPDHVVSLINDNQPTANRNQHIHPRNIVQIKCPRVD